MLRQRSSRLEILDTQTVTDARYAAVLADLAVVNTLTRARPPTLRFLARAAHRAPGRVFRILDVGFGEGDMLRRIHRWGTRRGMQFELAGIDLNPGCAAAARAATPPGMEIDYRTGDLFDVLPGGYDLVLSSLFTHHLDDAQLIAFLRWMEASAGIGWFVNDLHRHALAYHGFRLLAAAARFDPIVRHDGAISVTRGFRRRDWERLLRAAGVNGAAIEWHLPFRFCVSRLR